MKLNAEQVKKIALSSLLVIFLFYVYETYLIQPLNRKEANIEKLTNELQPKIDKANAQIQRTKAIERQFTGAQASITEIDASIPKGSPVAWFPTLVSDFFKRQGIKDATARMNGNADFAASGYHQIDWTIDLPKTEFVPLGIAVAALENEQPLMEITGIEVDAGIGDDTTTQFQHAILTVRNIVQHP